MLRKRIESVADVVGNLRGIYRALETFADLQRQGKRLDGMGEMMFMAHGATLEECARWLETGGRAGGGGVHDS